MIKKNKWKMDDGGWKSAQSDLLVDMKTSNNSLSLYQVDDDLTELDRILAALGANRDRITSLDYVLFDIQIISARKLRRENTSGETADNQVNACHFDLIDLTVKELIALTKRIFLEGKRFRVVGKALKGLLEESISCGFIDEARIRAKEYRQAE